MIKANHTSHINFSDQFNCIYKNLKYIRTSTMSICGTHHIKNGLERLKCTGRIWWRSIGKVFRKQIHTNAYTKIGCKEGDTLYGHGCPVIEVSYVGSCRKIIIVIYWYAMHIIKLNHWLENGNWTQKLVHEEKKCSCFFENCRNMTVSRHKLIHTYHRNEIVRLRFAIQIVAMCKCI